MLSKNILMICSKQTNVQTNKQTNTKEDHTTSKPKSFFIAKFILVAHCSGEIGGGLAPHRSVAVEPGQSTVLSAWTRWVCNKGKKGLKKSFWCWGANPVQTHLPSSPSQIPIIILPGCENGKNANNYPVPQEGNNLLNNSLICGKVILRLLVTCPRKGLKTQNRVLPHQISRKPTSKKKRVTHFSPPPPPQTTQ